MGGGMNYLSVFLAALGGFVAYFLTGGLLFVLLSALKQEFARHPAVYRPSEGFNKTMPIGMAAMFVSILVLAVIYAMLYRGGSGLMQGAELGALIGVFVLGAFVVHNYMMLNISWTLTWNSGIAYFLEWLAVGTVIGLIYRPLA